MLYSFKFQLPVFSDRQNLQNPGRFWIINDFLIIFQKITFKSWIIKAFDKIIQQRPFQTPEIRAQEHASWNIPRDDQIIPRNPKPVAGSPPYKSQKPDHHCTKASGWNTAQKPDRRSPLKPPKKPLRRQFSAAAFHRFHAGPDAPASRPRNISGIVASQHRNTAASRKPRIATSAAS